MPACGGAIDMYIINKFAIYYHPLTLLNNRM